MSLLNDTELVMRKNRRTYSVQKSENNNFTSEKKNNLSCKMRSLECLDCEIFQDSLEREIFLYINFPKLAQPIK